MIQGKHPPAPFRSLGLEIMNRAGRTDSKHDLNVIENFRVGND